MRRDTADDRVRRNILDAPEYYDPGHSVKLILRNNIVTRRLRQKDRAQESIPEQIWEQLDVTEQL